MNTLIKRIETYLNPAKARHVKENLTTSLNYSRYGISYRDAWNILLKTDMKQAILLRMDNPKTLLGGLWGFSHLAITIGMIIAGTSPALLWEPLGWIGAIVMYMASCVHWANRELGYEDHRRPRGSRLEDLDQEKTLDSILDLAIPVIGGLIFLIIIFTVGE